MPRMTPSERARIPFVEHLGIRLIEQSAERASIAFDRRPQLLNSWGVARGGVIMTLLDYVMGAAVRGHYGVENSVLTVDLSLGFMSAASADRLIAEGRVLHRGHAMAFCEAEARDENGRLLAKAIGTFKVLSAEKEQVALATVE